MPTMSQANRIISKFGGVGSLARALGHTNPTTVQGWAERGYIPPRQHNAVWEAAKAKHVSMTLADFAAVDEPSGEAAA